MLSLSFHNWRINWSIVTSSSRLPQLFTDVATAQCRLSQFLFPPSLTHILFPHHSSSVCDDFYILFSKPGESFNLNRQISFTSKINNCLNWFNNELIIQRDRANKLLYSIFHAIIKFCFFIKIIRVTLHKRCATGWKFANYFKIFFQEIILNLLNQKYDSYRYDIKKIYHSNCFIF